MTDQPSLTITPARASFAIALATIAGLLWSSTSYLVRQDHRITAVETYVTEQKAINRDLLDELKALSINVARLSTIMETMTRKVTTATETSVEAPGVVEIEAEAQRDRRGSASRDRRNYEISGASE